MLGVSSEKRCPGPSGQFVFLVVLLALVVLTAAPEAGARSVFALPAQTGGARLGGDRVLSAPSTDEGIPRTPMLISPGKEPRRLREFDPLLGLAAPPDRSDEPGVVGREIALGASARRLAVSLTITRTDYEATYSSTSNALSELWTSGLAGPASRTARCRGDNLRPIAVDGDVVAYGGAACDPNRASLGVRDFSPGAPAACASSWEVLASSSIP